MLKDHSQLKLPLSPYQGIYDAIIPANHLLRKMKENIDFSFINPMLRKQYCENFGRPAKEPEMMFKLLFLKKLYDLSDETLISSAQTDMAYKFFLDLEPEVGLWMKRVPIPSVGPNDVKIKIRKTAICGTDVHIYQWNDWAQHTIPVGLTAGHEYVGEVVEVGEGVQGFRPGHLVSGEGHITCGKCRNCLEGHKQNCKDAKGVGVNRDGAFAEYLVIPSSNVWPCNPAIPEELYAIFDPFGNATHTALSYEMLGEDVLVAGAGPIGIMAAAIAKFSGARHVVVTDMNPYRLELAKKLGATRTVNLKEEKLQ